MLKIGNTSFSDDLIASLKGKTKEEILSIRSNLHPAIVDEFVKKFPPEKKKDDSKPKKKEKKPEK